MDNVYVLPLVKATDVICIRHLTLMKNHIYGPCMIYHVELVAHILSLAIYWSRFAVANIVNKQRNQLFGKLIRSIVVRTVCHNSRHTVSIMKSAYKVITTRFRSRIG